MNSLQLKLCDIQGRLFKLAAMQAFSSECFVQLFMKSQVAKCLDSKYNQLQWAGEEYLMEAFLEEAGDRLLKSDERYSQEQMFWMGYLYRYWHFYTGESSKRIIIQAPVSSVRQSYMMFHTMDVSMAIDNLREMHQQHAGKKKRTTAEL